MQASRRRNLTALLREEERWGDEIDARLRKARAYLQQQECVPARRMPKLFHILVLNKHSSYRSFS